MKNKIEYYYNIVIDKIRLINETYYFSYRNQNYLFCVAPKTVNMIEVYNLNRKLLNINPQIHEIVLNKENKILTEINYVNYVLLKINTTINKKIDLNDIINFNYEIPGYYNISWKELWIKKVDNFEEYLGYIEDKGVIFREYYDYFIGMSEIAIQYLNIVENKVRIIPTISHRRINPNTTILDFYNPLNIIIDDISRDIAEYLKVSFFSGKKIENFAFLDSLSKESMILLISRLLFPTYFYDIFEQDDERKAILLSKIIDVTPEYEKFLKRIIDEIKKRTEVPEITWLQQS